MMSFFQLTVYAVIMLKGHVSFYIEWTLASAAHVFCAIQLFVSLTLTHSCPDYKTQMNFKS